MSEIQRLLRVAAGRNVAKDYTVARFRVLRSLIDRFRRRCAEEGHSGNVVLEACLSGYVNSHPAVLAMVDQWMRESGAEPTPHRGSQMSKRDLEEIYAASSRGIMTEEDTDE